VHGVLLRSMVTFTGPPVIARVKVTVPLVGTAVVGGGFTGLAASPDGVYVQPGLLPEAEPALDGAAEAAGAEEGV
jgi:hypothetical protein